MRIIQATVYNIYPCNYHWKAGVPPRGPYYHYYSSPMAACRDINIEFFSGETGISPEEIRSQIERAKGLVSSCLGFPLGMTGMHNAHIVLGTVTLTGFSFDNQELFEYWAERLRCFLRGDEKIEAEVSFHSGDIFLLVKHEKPRDLIMLALEACSKCNYTGSSLEDKDANLLQWEAARISDELCVEQTNAYPHAWSFGPPMPKALSIRIIHYMMSPTRSRSSTFENIHKLVKRLQGIIARYE